MRVIFNLIIILAALLIIFSFIFAFGPYKNRERFRRLMKKKATWVIMLLILLAPFLWYANYTMVLMLIRGDCFTAQHVYIGDHHFISYNDEAYVEFTDNAEIRKMYDTVGGDWSGGEGYVLRGPMRFPYLEYWELDMFIEDFEVSADGEYMITHTLGGQRNYRRAEE